MKSQFKLPRIGTKSLEILKFIGRNSQGRRLVDIEKFIVQNLRHREWDPSIRSGSWTISLYGFGNQKGLFEKYCTKVDMCWYLTKDTATLLKSIDPSIPYFCRPSDSSITTFDTKSVDDLSIQNAEKIPSNPYPSNPYEYPIRPWPSTPINRIYKPQVPAPSVHEQCVNAIKDLMAARTSVDNLQEELDIITKKLLDAKAKRADQENNVRKLLGL